MTHEAGSAQDVQPVLLDYRAAGAYMGVPPETFRGWVKRGLFVRIRVGRRSLVRRAELDAYISAQLED